MNNAMKKYIADLQIVVQNLADDLQLNMKLNDQGLQIEHDISPVLFRTTIRKTTVLQAIQDCQADNAVLLADFVPPIQARQLIAAQVNFIDACGNCYLTGTGLRVLIAINKERRPPPEERALGRAFGKEGLKATFAVLLNADKVNELTVRDIRDLAGVGTGTVHYALSDLKQRRYLLEKGGKKVLQKKKQLLMEWANAYRMKLRPKLLHGIYTPKKDIMKVEFGDKDKAVWGGEMAANKLGVGLWPGYWTIYTWGVPGRAIGKAGLSKDDRGTIEVLNLWFRAHGPTVPPLLVYADLITSGDARNLEAAAELEDKYNLFPEEN